MLWISDGQPPANAYNSADCIYLTFDTAIQPWTVTTIETTREGDIMQWMEIINIRTTEQGLENLVRDFIRPVTEKADDEGLSQIKIYYHALLKTDLSIHIYWDLNQSDQYKTTLGLRLMGILENFGLVYHSVWMAAGIYAVN